jgi:hypothetical protein
MAKALDLLQRKNDLESSVRRAQSQRMIFAGAFREPDPIHLLHRGDPERPGELVPPAVPAVLGQLELSPDTQEQERRRLLADWLANPNNPLTARVMVNRIWQSHFGLGLVETPSDFGLSGVPPSHPELLDWLASEFIRFGWSIKQVHRWIVLSATYAQSTQIQGEYHGRDADVRWLWRFPSRRLEAESIRDGMLAVNGQLNLQMFGRGFDLFDKRGGLTGFNPVESFEADGLRRMIYAHKVRRETEAVFGAFDCPDAGQSAARRAESTTPIQALNLFNSQFTWDASEAFASRLRSEVGDDLESQVRHAFLLALGREPKNGELIALLPVVEKAGLETFCRALYNSNEFLFVP